MVTVSATTTETSSNFTRGKAKFLSVTTDADVYIDFDVTAMIAEPSILLESGEALEIRDCDCSAIHAITSSGTATVKCVYGY